MKHSRSDFTRAILEEERSYMLANPHREQLAKIFSVAGTAYGRIDYAVKNSRVQTWEINLHPTIGRGHGESKALVPPELLPFREETKAVFYRSFQEAWAAVDLPMVGWAPGPVSEVGASAAHRRLRSLRPSRVPYTGSRRACVARPSEFSRRSPRRSSRAWPFVRAHARVDPGWGR